MFKQSTLLFGALAASTLAFSQVPLDSFYQTGYAANLTIGDSVVNLSNSGANGGFAGAGTTGNLCINVYAFDPEEEEISCCACLVTPDGLASLSVRSDLISNTLTPAVPNSVVIKLVSTTPGTDSAGNLKVCNPSRITAGIVASGMLAWGSTIEPSAGNSYTAIHAPFIPSTPNASEFLALVQTCGFIQSDGTGYGTCNSCQLGALAGSKK